MYMFCIHMYIINQNISQIRGSFISLNAYITRACRYTFYANNYMQALTLYGALSRECEAFINFTNEVRAEGAVTGSVESYLITPIQRIPRYVMLLHELKKATLPAHPDTPLLSLAVESIEEVANHVNEQVCFPQTYGSTPTLLFAY